MIPHPNAITTASPTVPCVPSLACPQCGTIDRPTIAPDKGPHAYRANCTHCHAFLKWVSRYTPAERHARRQHAREAAMAQLAPTALQLQHLKALGDIQPPPVNRAEASARIDNLKRAKRGS